jgi:hypothetical protein
MPSFFDLDRYIALWRSRALIHCFKTDDWERGRFAFYDVDRKKDMYLEGKKMYSYKFPSPNFHGKFVNHYCVDAADYKQRKLKALTDKESVKTTSKDSIKDLFFDRVMKWEKLTKHQDRWEFLGMKESNYYIHLRKWRLNNHIEDIEDFSLEN